MSSLLIVAGCCLLLVAASVQVNGHRLLSESDLISRPYKEVHRIAVLDQVNNHCPAQKSLHTRWTKSLNGPYDFCFDETGSGVGRKYQENNLRQVCPQASFRRMPVPSAFNEIASNTFDKNYMGWFWYQTDFDLPPDPQLQTNWHIQFESANYLAVVWIKKIGSANEAVMLGSHVGGHLPFVFNLSQFLVEERPHADQDHLMDTMGYRLTIAVNNMLNKDTIPSGRMEDLSNIVGRPFKRFVPDFDFFHFAGLLGDVNLIALPTAHFREVIYLGQSSPDGGQNQGATLGFRICVHSAEEVSMLDMAHISGVIRDSDRVIGKSWLRLDSPLKPCFDHNLTLDAQSVADDKRLSWSPVRSNQLHRFSSLVRVQFVLRVQILHSLGGPTRDVTDRFELTIGLKLGPDQVRAPADHLRGFGMHQEQLFSGRTMSLPAIMKDMYLLKKTNANLIRTSHYPYSKQYLDQCDEHGVQVIAECPAVGLNSFSDIKLALHKQILLEMLQRDHEHASIIMWSIANEPQSQMNESIRYFEELTAYVRQELAHYLTGRPITAAIAQSYKDDKVAHTLDVIMINNYFGWYDYTGVLEAIKRPLLASLIGWSNKHPSKRLLLSEHGAEAVSGLHRSSDEIFSEEYQQNLLLEYERVISEVVGNCNGSTTSNSNTLYPMRRPEIDKGNATSSNNSNNNSNNGIRLIGSMIWNFADFETHQSLTRVAGNRKGIFTRTRDPKMAAHAIARSYGQCR